MNGKRVIAGAVLVALAVVTTGLASAILHARQRPAAEKVLTDVETFFLAKGYQLKLRVRGVARTRPPMFVRLGELPRTIRGVWAGYQHGHVDTYSGDRGSTQVAVDVCGNQAYRVTLIGGTFASEIFPELSQSLKSLGLPIGFEAETAFRKGVSPDN